MNQINVLLNYSNITVEYLEQVVSSYMEIHDILVSNLLNIPDEILNYNNLVRPFIEIDDNCIQLNYLTMKDLYTDENIRTKCSELSNKLSKWSIEQSMRKDIYNKYKYYYNNAYLIERDNLSLEQITHITNLMTKYQIKGMDLDDDKFNQLKEIKKQLSELCNNYRMNLGKENYTEFLSENELEGLPTNYLNERRQEDGTIKITLKYPDYIPIQEYAKSRELRKRLNCIFKSKCKTENLSLAEQVFQLRNQMTKLFDFENYSDYKLQQTMAENTETVMNFLNNLLEQVKPLLRRDLDYLLELAKEDGIEKLEVYDITYYSRLFVEKTCNFSKEELKKYFPCEKVISGALTIYQQLLGFNFEKVLNMDSTFWHPSVELYKVSDSQTNQTVGYFYLDLYPREGKYGHAACFPFISKSITTYPVATMVCNFSKDNLTFSEVETFFHEFGHVMHHISSESTISSTSAFTCEHDFVETPSQMFEEWCYYKEPLKYMSDNLPEELVEKLNQSSKLLQGYHYARQLFFAIFDMTIHQSKTDMKPDELFKTLHYSILGLESPKDSCEIASFGHLFGGYDSGYYGYLWSLVYAKDLFSQFKKDGIMNSELGLKLRKQVLSQGSMRKSMESIKYFLGREPSNDEFINSLI
jgi:Zn-dependent oligopeptidase